MTEIFLIAHKVRGEPAFDVATKMEMPDGPWWIIPTSGHRAFPYWTHEISHLTVAVPILPADLPDHYPRSEYTDRATRPPQSGRPSVVPNLEDI
jgi:hypothetical protein